MPNRLIYLSLANYLRKSSHFVDLVGGAGAVLFWSHAALVPPAFQFAKKWDWTSFRFRFWNCSYSWPPIGWRINRLFYNKSLSHKWVSFYMKYVRHGAWQPHHPSTYFKPVKFQTFDFFFAWLISLICFSNFATYNNHKFGSDFLLKHTLGKGGKIYYIS